LATIDAIASPLCDTRLNDDPYVPREAGRRSWLPDARPSQRTTGDRHASEATRRTPHPPGNTCPCFPRQL